MHFSYQHAGMHGKISALQWGPIAMSDEIEWQIIVKMAPTEVLPKKNGQRSSQADPNNCNLSNTITKLVENQDWNVEHLGVWWRCILICCSGMNIPRSYAYLVLWFGDRQIRLPLIHFFFPFYLLTTQSVFYSLNLTFSWMPVKLLSLSLSLTFSLALTQNIPRNNERKLASFWSSFYWLHVFSLLSFIGYFLSFEEREKNASKN